MYFESTEPLLPSLPPVGVDVDGEPGKGANLHLEIVDVARDVVTVELGVGARSESRTEDHNPGV